MYLEALKAMDQNPKVECKLYNGNSYDVHLDHFKQLIQLAIDLVIR